MIAKRYKNDGGGLSKEEQEDFGKKYNELMLKEREFQVVQLNLQEDNTLSLEERQEKLTKIVEETEVLKADLEKYEVVAESLYEHTAEARAARRTNMWWLFFLTHIKFKNEDRGGIEDFKPFFEGKTFDDKAKFYEEIEEMIAETDNEFGTNLIERASYLLAAWNGGNAKTYEDFQRVDESLDFIKEEVRKDESLQEVYDEKIKELAGLDIEVPEPKEEPKEEPKKEPKEEIKEEPTPDEKPKVDEG